MILVEGTPQGQTYKVCERDGEGDRAGADLCDFLDTPTSVNGPTIDSLRLSSEAELEGPLVHLQGSPGACTEFEIRRLWLRQELSACCYLLPSTTTTPPHPRTSTHETLGRPRQAPTFVKVHRIAPCP